MAHPSEEALVQTLIAVDGIVGTVHMAQALTEDPVAQETLQAVLLVALSARSLIEDRVEGDPIKEPQKNPYATMGQPTEEEPAPITLGTAPADCEHENVLTGIDGSLMCVHCGEDPRGTDG
ncbi:hypothetical protein SEA_OTTAWA_4 [Arthrobacter phage Ottawa]|nr:hypothetical protein SEA_KHARCHO_4 [Arthrobacter phage Kharcho]WIC89236.1 hypothetical protein SEA_OTTAWA_4 [Arthrobacter phage Ottawa]